MSSPLPKVLKFSVIKEDLLGAVCGSATRCVLANAIRREINPSYDDIAAFLSVNSGRIAEIAKGYKSADVTPARKADLPPPAALGSGFLIWQARQALARAKAGIESAMAYLDECDQQRDVK
jgi:cytochrome c551/c552